MHLFTRQISASIDECSVWWDVTQFVLECPWPRLYVGYGDATHNRFGQAAIYRNIQIPKGSHIAIASLLCCAWETNPNREVNTYISAELNVNPQPFTTISDYWARQRTANPVPWDDIRPFVTPNWYGSPNFASQIQQVIDLPDWESGKDICIFWQDHDNRSTHAPSTDRAPYAYHVYPACATWLRITYTLPPEPKPPPVPDNMWAIEKIVQLKTATGYIIIVTTDRPCHLYMRWSTNPPQQHTIPVERRGIQMHVDKYFCFTAYKDNEQEEEHDTIIHTFIKEPWPVCETRWFYFHGTISNDPSPSTSPIFEKHFLGPLTHDYRPCWHNRMMYSSHGTWDITRNGYNPRKTKTYQRPTSELAVATGLNASYFINRAYINFDTMPGLPGDPIIKAELGLFVTSIPSSHFPLCITKGLWQEPVVDTDWLLQTPETTILGSLNTLLMTPGQYNWIPFNDAGIAWLNSSRAEHRQHESFDWQKTAYFHIYGSNWCSESFTPQTTHTITRIKVRIKKIGSPPTLYCDIYRAGADHCPTGAPIASDSVHPDYIPTGIWGDWYEFTFTPGATLFSGIEYCVVLHHIGGDASNMTQWIGATASQYPNGKFCRSTDTGASWTSYDTYDAYFIEYEEQLEGQTNFCLRTAPDVGNSPPGAGQNFTIHFHSAQKGEGYLPILKVTT
ncbi:hypothetical protein ES702_03784 [subsurface metagenome]